MQVPKQALREGGANTKRKGRGNGRNKEACADWSPLVPGGDAASAPGHAAVWWAPEQDGVFRAALYGNPGAPMAPQVRSCVLTCAGGPLVIEGRTVACLGQCAFHSRVNSVHMTLGQPTRHDNEPCESRLADADRKKPLACLPHHADWIVCVPACLVQSRLVLRSMLENLAGTT